MLAEAHARLKQKGMVRFSKTTDDSPQAQRILVFKEIPQDRSLVVLDAAADLDQRVVSRVSRLVRKGRASNGQAQPSSLFSDEAWRGGDLMTRPLSPVRREHVARQRCQSFVFAAHEPPALVANTR